MKINVTIAKKNGAVYATGIYEGDTFIVQKGGKVEAGFADHIRGGKTAKAYRSDPEYVDKDGNILKDCEFKSPSTAAQFVLGTSSNGYESWKVEKKMSLGKYLKEKGLR